MKSDDCPEQLSIVRQENAQLGALLRVDFITGLPIRRVLAERLRPLVGESDHRAFALGVVRLDERFHRRFTEGSLVEILTYTVGQRLLSLAPGDVYQSWRTDEFVILVEDPDLLTDLHAFGICLREAVSAPLQHGAMDIRLGCNIGFAVYPEHGSTVSELLGNAELALGIMEIRDGTTIVYDDSMGRRRRRVFEIEHAIAEEIQNGLEGFSLAFQPVVDTERRIRGAEALTRWNSAILGPVSPGEFIPIAEHYGQIQILGLWAVFTASTIAGRWGRSDRLHPIVSVNVSAIQLRDPEFADRFVELIEAGGGDPSRFRLELTESAIIDDPDLAQHTLKALRERGVHLLVDDFGTGFSSFSYLHRLPIATIKIAKEFVDTILDSDHSRAIVQSIVQVAHSIGGTALVEGVESEEQYRVLREEGCDFFQGYLFGRPKAVDDLELLVLET